MKTLMNTTLSFKRPCRASTWLVWVKSRRGNGDFGLKKEKTPIGAFYVKECKKDVVLDPSQWELSKTVSILYHGMNNVNRAFPHHE